MADDRDIRFLRLPEVEARVGLKRAMIYRLIQRKTFPAPRHQGRVSFWVDAEIRAWQLACLA